MAIGEEADVADAVEAVRHGVLKEAADEFVGGQGHDLGFAALAVVLPGEADPAVVEADQAAVGDGDAMGVAAEIAENLLRSGEGRLGVDHPVDGSQGIEAGSKGAGLGQAGESAGEAKFAVGSGTPRRWCRNSVRNVSERTRTGRKNPRRAGDPACLVGCDAAAGDDAVQVRVVVQRLAPGMQHGDRAHFGPQVSRFGGTWRSASAAARNRMA